MILIYTPFNIIFSCLMFFQALNCPIFPEEKSQVSFINWNGSERTEDMKETGIIYYFNDLDELEKIIEEVQDTFYFIGINDYSSVLSSLPKGIFNKNKVIEVQLDVPNINHIDSRFWEMNNLESISYIEVGEFKHLPKSLIKAPKLNELNIWLADENSSFHKKIYKDALKIGMNTRYNSACITLGSQFHICPDTHVGRHF